MGEEDVRHGKMTGLCSLLWMESPGFLRPHRKVTNASGYFHTPVLSYMKLLYYHLPCFCMCHNGPSTGHWVLKQAPCLSFCSWSRCMLRAISAIVGEHSAFHPVRPPAVLTAQVRRLGNGSRLQLSLAWVHYERPPGKGPHKS